MPTTRVPGPDGGPLGLRNAVALRADPLGFVRRLAADHGDLVRFEIGATAYYLLSRPEYARIALVDHADRLQKPALVRDSNRGYWGDGLTTLEGEDWRARRAAVRPAFRSEAHAELVAECTEDALSGLRPGEPLPLRRALRVLTARIAARTLFDAEVEGFGSPEANRRRSGIIRFDEAFGEDFRAGASPLRSRWSLPPEFTAVAGVPPIAPMTLTRPRARRDMESTIAIIDDRLRSGEARGDALSALVAAARAGHLRRDEVVGEIMQMFFAGHHTVPETLVQLFRALARHPEVARRLQEEVDRLPPGHGAAAPPYCELVLKESLRVSPAAPMLYREVKLPFEVGGHTLEPGAVVWICPLVLHHDPRNFPDPEAFLPERFDRRHAHEIPEHAYLPFGGGPRLCTGHRLAMTQMALIAALTARRYRLSPQASGVAEAVFDVEERPRATSAG